MEWYENVDEKCDGIDYKINLDKKWHSFGDKTENDIVYRDIL